MRAIEKFAARRRVRRSYHAKAAWTRTRSWCNEEAIDDRQRRRDRSTASGITFATIGAEISGLWRVSILCSTRNTGAPSVPNVVDDPYRTVMQDFVEALEQVAKDTSFRVAKNFISLCLYVLIIVQIYYREAWFQRRVKDTWKLLTIFLSVVSFVRRW